MSEFARFVEFLSFSEVGLDDSKASFLLDRATIGFIKFLHKCLKGFGIAKSLGLTLRNCNKRNQENEKQGHFENKLTMDRFSCVARAKSNRSKATRRRSSSFIVTMAEKRNNFAKKKEVFSLTLSS